ncbi:unnamed protein product [Adineta steineri]|uniref:Uncharacterized protein n=1 Tax=Adineta steineri TaxID=433720 RepID=A0A818ITK3_9BILA|nr:unnamed protein product [Adineta steineri]CAF1280122.1 unnamed protein product [Adineta steineri]CAF3528320.1 unnamed protein product [Adineta steineri]CAF3766876.1 unnamed protein product [Adineta steineri]
MVTTTPILPTSTVSYDEILSTAAVPISSTDTITEILSNDYDLTTYLLIIFPFYVCAVLFNFLSIYSILIAKIYRQYLSNVLLAVICVGALFNVHGQMFLILLRWTNDSASNQLCSSSIYLRDSGSILIHTHILLLTFERILANIKKSPANLNNNLIQRAHLFLITMSLISIILSLTVTIYTFTHSNFSSFAGLCIPTNLISYQKYFDWIYFGFGHPFVWLSCLLLGIYFSRKTTISYTTLIPMNRIIFIISISSCFNLLLRTLFDDSIGIGDERPLDINVVPSKSVFYIMNLRDFISIIDKLLIGLLFFLFRPEIRLWLIESMKKFQSNKKETLSPQMLDIRNELDDNYNETDDGNLQFRADT